MSPLCAGRVGPLGCGARSPTQAVGVPPDAGPAPRSPESQCLPPGVGGAGYPPSETGIRTVSSL